MDARYFAYGSNMDAQVMRSWCPEAQLLGIACLDGYSFDLRRESIRWEAGVADLVADAGGEVWGVIYGLPAAALVGLDQKEGVQIGAYERIEVRVRTDDGNDVEAVAYTVVEKTPARIPPSREYAQLLMSAAVAAGLPDGYRRRLAAVLGVNG